MFKDLEAEHIEATAKNLQQAGNLAAAGLAFSITQEFNPWFFALGVLLWAWLYWIAVMMFQWASRRKKFTRSG